MTEQNSSRMVFAIAAIITLGIVISVLTSNWPVIRAAIDSHFASRPIPL